MGYTEGGNAYKACGPGVFSDKGTLDENVCNGTAVVRIDAPWDDVLFELLDGGELRLPVEFEFVLGLCEPADGVDCIKALLGVCGGPGGTKTGAEEFACGKKYVIGCGQKF